MFTPNGGTNQEKSVGDVIHALCMRGKQKIVQARGPSNINLGIYFCYFDVCQAS